MQHYTEIFELLFRKISLQNQKHEVFRVLKIMRHPEVHQYLTLSFDASVSWYYQNSAR